MTWVATRRDERKGRQCHCGYCKDQPGGSPRILKIGDGEALDELAMRIGALVLNLPRTSAQAGHKSPWSTLLDYVRLDPKQDFIGHEAAEFLKDIACLTTEQMMRKWFCDPPPEVEPWELEAQGPRARAKPYKTRPRKALPEKPAPVVPTPYCSECPKRGLRYRAVRDGLCALHLSRRNLLAET